MQMRSSNELLFGNKPKPRYARRLIRYIIHSSLIPTHSTKSQPSCIGLKQNTPSHAKKKDRYTIVDVEKRKKEREENAVFW
jgi:hypothetical protein